jgi:4,5-DOPA dioxygenase extradiol
MNTNDTKRMPAVFVGHGNPMNSIRRNQWTAGWSALGTILPRPKAILAISAHWYVPATMATVMEQPRTIHDFGGFPEELYKIRYTAPGNPPLAIKVRDWLSPTPVMLDREWGLDHGTWSVLCHIFPEADIPVVQLSVDRRQPASFHYEIGKLLAPLRDEEILILGSGNLVHNLQAYNWNQPDAAAYDWAVEFETKVRNILQSEKDELLVDYHNLGSEARLSVPTPDHYLPLLYVLGTRTKDENVNFPIEGFEGGSMSMLSINVGHSPI